ncbi:MAG: hypothetical protein OXC03_08645 [Flavobacteriaceae bacterium]|nr:hypothetical protein [Flavobacteriaceae bacterium]
MLYLYAGGRLQKHIIPKKNIAYMKKQGFHWVSVDRTKPDSCPEGKPDKKLKLSDDTNLKLWLLSCDEQEQKIYVHSEARKK